jgi:hypothetical protein
MVNYIFRFHHTFDNPFSLGRGFPSARLVVQLIIVSGSLEEYIYVISNNIFLLNFFRFIYEMSARVYVKNDRGLRPHLNELMNLMLFYLLYYEIYNCLRVHRGDRENGCGHAHDDYDVHDVNVFHYDGAHDVHVHENDCMELFNLNARPS